MGKQVEFKLRRQHLKWFRDSNINITKYGLISGFIYSNPDIPHAGVVLRVAHAGLEPLRLAVRHALPAPALALLDALFDNNQINSFINHN